jgi:hypothetical protein
MAEDPSRRKEKMARPYDSVEGEKAYEMIAAKVITDRSGRALEGKPHLEEAEERPAYPLAAALVQGRRFWAKEELKGRQYPL